MNRTLYRFAPALLLAAAPGCFSPNAAAGESTSSTTGGPDTTGSSSDNQGPTSNPVTVGPEVSTTQPSSETTDTTDTGARLTSSGSGTTGGDDSTSSTSRDDGSGGSGDTSTGAAPVSFEGDYEGVILGDCQQFPTGFVDVDGTLSFAIFEDTAISGSADLTVPYSNNTVPLTGTIDEEGVAQASLQVSTSVSCALVGNAVDNSQITGTFTCVPHECDGLWSASAI